MTRAEAVDLSLSLAGGVGVAAGVTVTLAGFGSGELAWADGLRLFAAGLLSLLAGRPEDRSRARPASRRPPRKGGR